MSWSLVDRFLVGEEGDQKALLRWRRSVGLTCLGLVLAMGASPFWAPKVLVTKTEAQEAHDAISKEVGDLKKGVETLNGTVGSLANQLATAEAQRRLAEEERKRVEEAKAIRDIRQQIYTTQRDACQASGQVRSLLLQQVDALRSEFMALTGTEYPQLNCEGF